MAVRWLSIAPIRCLFNNDGVPVATLRLLARRCGPLSEATSARIQALPLEQLESFTQALLDFLGPDVLSIWLASNS